MTPVVSDAFELLLCCDKVTVSSRIDPLMLEVYVRYKMENRWPRGPKLPHESYTKGE